MRESPLEKKTRTLAMQWGKDAGHASFGMSQHNNCSAICMDSVTTGLVRGDDGFYGHVVGPVLFESASTSTSDPTIFEFIRFGTNRVPMVWKA